MSPSDQSNAFLIYQDDNGISNVNVRFEGEDVWLTVEQLQALFQTTQQNISLHINNIYKEGELEEDRTHKKYLLVRSEGSRSVKRNISHYNLDMILAVGMRAKSDVAVRFRRWAIRHLHEFAVKGFTLDDNRLKGNSSRYFRELLQRVRDIRMSERNFYQKVTDIFATAIDYDRTADMTRTFFATVQNKLHFAAPRHTAAELIYARVDASKPMVGKISHEEACRKAVEEFREYRRREMIQYESDFDRAIRELSENAKQPDKEG